MRIWSVIEQTNRTIPGVVFTAIHSDDGKFLHGTKNIRKEFEKLVKRHNLVNDDDHATSEDSADSTTVTLTFIDIEG